MNRNKGRIITIGFVKLDNEVWQDIIDETGDQNALIVYIALLAHRNTKTNNCFPSREVISKETELNISTVGEKIAKLYYSGFITKIPGKSGKANQYYFPKEEFYCEFLMDENQSRAAKFAAYDNKHKDNKSHLIEREPEAVIRDNGAMCTEWMDDDDDYCPF